MPSRWNADWQRLGFKETEIAASVCLSVQRLLVPWLPGTFERPGAFFQISGGAVSKKSISRQGQSVSRGRGQTFAPGQCLDQEVKLVKAEMEVAHDIFRQHL